VRVLGLSQMLQHVHFVTVLSNLFCKWLFQRLRTENRLLKQRIDTLEKVSASVFVTGALSPDKLYA